MIDVGIVTFIIAVLCSKKLFEKILAYYTRKMYYYAHKSEQRVFLYIHFKKSFTSRLKWYIISRNDYGNTLPWYSKQVIPGSISRE